MSESKPEPRTYTGHCHCGRVQFEATTDFARVIECNCSICSTRGYLLTFVPADHFKLLSGADALTEYRFGKKRIDHAFCSTCGVGSFGRGARPDGTAMYAVNVRCLDGVDRAALAITPVDGRSFNV